MDELRQTFPKDERLGKREEFLRVYGQGKKIEGPHFFLYLLDNGLSRSRLGITVSRKVGQSVVRNRIRRRLREIFRTHKALIHPPSDVVVNAKRSAAVASFSSLRDDFVAALRRPGEGRKPACGSLS